MSEEKNKYENFQHFVKTDGTWVWINVDQILYLELTDYVYWDDEKYHDVCKVVLPGFKVQFVTLWGTPEDIMADIKGTVGNRTNFKMRRHNCDYYVRILRSDLDDHKELMK